MTEATTPIRLSKRQKQLMAMLTQGLSNAQIAEQLELSEQTIKVHFWRMFQKIGVHSRGQALKWWHDHQPATELFALRAAFNAACRLTDQIMMDGGIMDPAEFLHHRAQVLQIQGAVTC